MLPWWGIRCTFPTLRNLPPAHDHIETRPQRRVFYCLESNLLEVYVKLKAKSNLLERARTAWEAVARQVGETDFSRHPRTGEYLHPGVAVDWRIHKKNL